jgi:anti-sigma factor RsiW
MKEMDCSRYRKLLSAYLDNELLEDELAEVNEHLKVCPGCTRELERLRLVQTLYKLELENKVAPQPSFDFSQRVVDLALEEEVSEGVRSWNIRSWWKRIISKLKSPSLRPVAAATLIAILLIISVGIFSTFKKRERLVDVYQLASRDSKPDEEQVIDERELDRYLREDVWQASGRQLNDETSFILSVSNR